MGLFDRFRRGESLNEEALRVRVSAMPNRESELGVSSIDDDITEKQLESGTCLIDAAQVDKFTSLSKFRDERYAAYEEMLTDPVVSAALKKYADDSTQYNTDGRILWASSEDPIIAQAANRLIKVLSLENNAWRDIKALGTYGDFYYRLYREGDESESSMDSDSGMKSTIGVRPHDNTRKLEERVEYVTNPAAVFDLQEKDKTVGFVRLKVKPSDDTRLLNHEFLSGYNQPISTVSSNNFDMMNNTSYVHFCLSDSIDRFPQYFGIKDGEGKTTQVYKIKSGHSILEEAYQPTRQLKLLQDSLLLNRLTRSAIIRILQVEVGDMPQTQQNLVMHRLKNFMEQKMSVNTESGAARSYNSPGPIDNIIYMPTKEGKGSVEQVVVGGDVNIKDIVDIEYFQNKQLAAIGIPKAYLNFDSAEGLSNTTKLTKLDAGYAHTIMRIQNAYTKGIANILNLFFIDKNLDYVNKFTVHMVPPATAEELDRSDLLTASINQVRDLMDLYRDFDQKTRNEILKTLTDDLIRIPNVSEILDKATKEDEKNKSEAQDETTNDMEISESKFEGSNGLPQMPDYAINETATDEMKNELPLYSPETKSEFQIL